MAKKAVKKEGKLKSTFANSAKHVAAFTDVANKVWYLLVAFTLWGAAYVIYMCSEAGVPQDVKRYLAAALFVFGLGYLFGKLASAKPAGNVVE